MSSLRQKRYTRLYKMLAAVLGLLLFQALGAALLHVSVVEHTYCESHQAVEHLDESGDSPEHSAHARLDDHHDLPDDDPGPTDESCDWLTWLQGPSVPLPQVQAELLDLPPPAAADTMRPMAEGALLPPPIDLLRLAPGHSPPVHSA
jgi:hypothetical protein